MIFSHMLKYAYLIIRLNLLNLLEDPTIRVMIKANCRDMDMQRFLKTYSAFILALLLANPAAYAESLNGIVKKSLDVADDVLTQDTPDWDNLVTKKTSDSVL